MAGAAQLPTGCPAEPEPETITLTGKWELDGQIVAKVSADFNLAADDVQRSVQSIVNASVARRRLSIRAILSSAVNTLRQKLLLRWRSAHAWRQSRFLSQQRPVSVARRGA